MTPITKIELVQAARKALKTARNTTCPEFKAFMLHRAAIITKELNARLYREKLNRLVLAFPKRVVYYY